MEFLKEDEALLHRGVLVNEETVLGSASFSKRNLVIP